MTSTNLVLIRLHTNFLITLKKYDTLVSASAQFDSISDKK